MTITLTLSEVLSRCKDWDYFCKEEGWSEWAVNEGGGHIEVNLSEEQCHKYGIIKGEIP